MARTSFILLVAGIALAASLTLACSKDRNVLWTIAHDRCVPDEEAHGDPAPCARVDLSHGKARGYVILKDLRGVAQFLLIPTRRISGIESPALLAPDAENYWADAWANRNFVIARVKDRLGWDDIGLAINSAFARGQDQLHIHIDCVSPDVKARLARHIGEIGTQWRELSFDLAGRRFWARRLAAADLKKEDPFKLLAFGLPKAGHEAGHDMALESLAVVGVSFAPKEKGFVLLSASGIAIPGMGAHGEDLLDHSCALAQMR